MVAALVVAALVATLVVLVVREPPRTPLDPPPSVPSSAGVPSERTATPIETVFIDLGYQCVLELDDMAEVFGCYLRTTSSGDLTFRWLVDASDTVIAYQFYGTSADFDEHAAVAIREATDETSSAVLETKQELAADSTRPVETDWGTHQVRRFGEDRYDLQGTRQGEPLPELSGPRFAVEPIDVSTRAAELGYNCQSNSTSWIACAKDGIVIDATQLHQVMYRILADGSPGAESEAADRLKEFVDILVPAEAADAVREALDRADKPGVEMAAGYLVSVYPGTVRILRITVW